MPDQPVPLREALREAIVELLVAHESYVKWSSMDITQNLVAKEKRIYALLSHIPNDLEAREGDG